MGTYKYGIWNMEYGIQNTEYGIQNTEYRLSYNTEYGITLDTKPRFERLQTWPIKSWMLEV